MGEREGNQQERSEKGDEKEGAKVNEESCGGEEEEEEVQEGEGSERRSRSDGSSRKMEAEWKQNEERRKEIAHGSSREEEKEEADSQEEKGELGGSKEGSEGEEDLDRCSLSNGGAAASSLERGAAITEAGASDLEESAALKPRASQLSGGGSEGAPPAGLPGAPQRRERLAGSLPAEVGLRLGSLSRPVC